MTIVSSKKELREAIKAVHSPTRALRQANDLAAELEALVDWEYHPSVAVVRTSRRLMGLAVAEERVLRGVRVGLVSLDAVTHLIAVAPGMGPSVLSAAIYGWIASRTIFRLAFRAPAEGEALGTIRQTAASLKVDAVEVPDDDPTRRHYELRLPNTYNDFLEEILGPHVRRNFRHDRRVAEKASIRYVGQMTVEQARKAIAHLAKKNIRGADPKNSLKHVNRIAAHEDRPFFAGLQAKNGDWLALTFGWYANEKRAVMVHQLNDSEQWPKISLSIVLRGYLIEDFIKQGVESLVFWGGVSLPLLDYAHPFPSKFVYLYGSTPFSRGVRFLLRWPR